MANFFDQFDAPSQSSSTSNFFDRFDDATPAVDPIVPTDAGVPALAEVVARALPTMARPEIPQTDGGRVSPFDVPEIPVQPTGLAEQIVNPIAQPLHGFMPDMAPQPVPAVPEPDWTDERSLAEIMLQRGRQIAAGAAEVPASVPEALAIAGAGNPNASALLASEIVAEAEAQFDEASARLAANPDMNQEDRARLEAVITDSQERIKAYTPLVEIAQGPIKPDADQRPLFSQGQAVRDAVTDRVGAPDPTDETFGGKLAQGAGSLIGFVGSTLLTGIPGAAATGAAVNSAQTYREARAEGLTDEEAKVASGLAGILGTSEVIPIGRALDLLPTSKLKGSVRDAIARRLTDAMLTGGEEAAQEALVTIGNNVIAAGYYDPERGWSDDVGESALIGAILGSGLGAITSSAGDSPLEQVAAGPEGTTPSPSASGEPPEPDEPPQLPTTSSPARADAAPGFPQPSNPDEVPNADNGDIRGRGGGIPDYRGGAGDAGGVQSGEPVGRPESDVVPAARGDSQAERPGGADVAQDPSSTTAGIQRAGNLDAPEALSPEPTSQDAALPEAPEAPQKKQLTNIVRREIGQIDPNGVVGQELKQRGVTPQTAPALFRAGGLSEIDNIVAAENPDLANLVGLEDDGIYLNRNGLIDALAREQFEPAPIGRQGEVQDRYRKWEQEVAAIESGIRSDPDIDVPLSPGVPSWIIPDRESDISTGQERIDMIDTAIGAFQREVYGEGLFSSQERREMVDYLDRVGGSVEAAIERLVIGDIGYAETGTRPGPATPEDVSRSDSVDPERSEDPAGPEGRSAPSSKASERARQGTAEGGGVDLTPDGEQLVIPGAEQITDRELAERQQQEPQRGGDAPPPEGGLFDDDARSQTDLFNDDSGSVSDAAARVGRRPPGKLSPTFTEFSYTNRRSVFGHAFREAGIDPEEGSLMPLQEQLRIVSDAVEKRFGINVEVPKVKVQRKNLAGRKVTEERTSLSERKVLDQLLNAYRQLQMLAHVMSVPEKAIGLPIKGKGITLSLVSGNKLRGALGMFSWGASGRTIHLPDMSNSFAHEWGHALDHYLAAMADRPMLKGLLSRRQANRGLTPPLSPKRALTDAFAHVIWSMYGNSSQAGAIVLQAQIDSAQLGKNGKPTPKAKRAQTVLNGIREGRVPPAEYLSDYFKTSQAYDEQIEGDGYFTDPAEMFARAFEAMVGTEVAKVSDQPQAFLSKGEWAYSDTTDARAALTFPKDVDLQQFTLAMGNLAHAMARVNLFGSDAPAKAPENHDVMTTRDLLRADGTLFENLTAGEAREWGRTIQLMKDMPAATKEKADQVRDGVRLFGRQVLQTSATTAFAVADRQTNPEARAALTNIANAIGKRPGRGKLVTNIWEQNMRQTAGANINKVDQAVRRALKGVRGVTRTFSEQDKRDLRRLLTNTPLENARPQLKKLAADLRQILDSVWYDLDNAGIKMSYASGYLPHIYDADLAAASPDKFRDRAARVYSLMFQREVINATDGEGQVKDMQSIYRGLMRATDPNASGDRTANPKLSTNDANTIEEFFDKLKEIKQAERRRKGLKTEAKIAEADTDLAELKAQADKLKSKALTVLRDGYARHSAEKWLVGLRTGDLDEFGSVGPTATFLEGRVLPNEAGEIMADFMHDNPIEMITDYIFTAARRAEYAKLFGAENEKLSNMLDAAEGASKEDVDMMKMAVQAATGRILPPASGWQAFNSTVFSLGNMSLLSLSALSSLAEPITAGLRSGQVRDSFKALVEFIGGAVRIGRTREIHELARTVGLIMPYATDTLIQNRLGADVMNARPWLQSVVSQAFIVNGLTPLTHYQRAMMLPVANDVLLRHLRNDVTGKRNVRDRLFADKDGFSASELNEMGIPRDDRKSLLDWMESVGGMPAPDDLYSPDGEMHRAAELWSRATYRFATETIQDPLKSDRTMLANNPTLAPMYGIMSFIDAFTRNIIWRNLERGFKDDDTKIKRGAKLGFNVTAAMLPALTLYLGQFLTGILREAVFNGEEWQRQEEEDNLEEWLMARALDRTGYTGRLSPIVNAWTGIRYETDSTSVFAGPYASYFARNIDKIIRAETSDRNSAQTNTAEYNAARALYQVLVKPVGVGLMSGLAPGGAVSGNMARAGVGYLSMRSTEHGFAEGLVGEKGAKHVGPPPWWEMGG